MKRIRVFTCGRGILVAFRGERLKTVREYWSYRNGSYSLISRVVARNWFQKIGMTIDCHNHVTSDYFSEVRLTPQDLSQLNRKAA